MNKMKITPIGIYSNNIACTIIMKDGERISTLNNNQTNKYIEGARKRGEGIDFEDVKEVSRNCNQLLKLLESKNKNER